MKKSVMLFSREFRHLFVLALPLIVAQLMQSCSGFIGSAMVARLGPSAVAASGLVMVTWLTLSVVCFGVLNAISMLIAHQMGSKQYKKIGVIFWQGIWLAILLSIPVMLLVWFEPSLLVWARIPSKVTGIATGYLHTIVWMMLPLAIIIVMEQFLLGIGKTRLVLWINLIQIPLEVLANYAFIFGKFGLPAFGVAGLGYGFTLVFILADVSILSYLFFSSIGLRFSLLKQALCIDVALIKAIIKTGLPIGFMYGIEVAAFAVISFMMGRLGAVTLAAHQIAMQYLEVSSTIVFSVSQAITVRVAFGVGENDMAKVKRAAAVGLLFSFVLMIFIALLYTVFAQTILKVDLNPALTLSSPSIKLAVTFLGVMALFQLIDGQRFSLIGILRGLKDTKIPMFISFLTYWVIGLSASYLLGFKLGYRGVGIWWALTFSVLCGGLILWFRLLGLLKSIDLTDVAKIT